MKIFVDSSHLFKWLSRALPQPLGPGKKPLLDFPKKTQNKQMKENKMKERCQIFGELVETLFHGFQKIKGDRLTSFTPKIIENLY